MLVRETPEGTRLPVGWFSGQHGKYRFVVQETDAGKWRLSCPAVELSDCSATVVWLPIAWYKFTALCLINIYFIVWQCL